MINLNHKNWSLIRKINKRWNDRITYMSDTEHYHKDEYWSFPHDSLGDCEDYAIAKHQALLSHCIESKFATCWVETGGYHAVLVVSTDYGDFVLDNRYDEVKHFKDLPYKWHKIEGDDGQWYDIV
jgi:predicted transglutaminase-like cysteine proteinase